MLGTLTLRARTSPLTDLVYRFDLERDEEGVHFLDERDTWYGDGTVVRVAAWLAPILAGDAWHDFAVTWSARDVRLAGRFGDPHVLLDTLAAACGAEAIEGDHAALAAQLAEDVRAGNHLLDLSRCGRITLGRVHGEDRGATRVYTVESWSDYGVVAPGFAGSNGLVTELTARLAHYLFSPRLYEGAAVYRWESCHTRVPGALTTPLALWDGLVAAHHQTLHLVRPHRRLERFCPWCRNLDARRTEAEALFGAA